MADRLQIGLDVDGVLAAFSPAFIAIANKLFGLKLKPEDQTGWAHQSLGLNNKQADKVWDVINETPNWWLEELPPLPNTDAVTNASLKHRLYFITKRNPTECGLPMEDQTAVWLRRHFFISNPTVIVTERKGDVANALELDYFIDDKYENCLDVQERSPNTRVFLQSAPYNLGQMLPAPMHIAWNVNHFFESIKTLGAFNGIREAA
jgi:uncharacterized HAD superfamily protein